MAVITGNDRMQTAEGAGGQMIQSVQRALSILKTLSHSGTKLGVKELSSRLQLSPSTICRLASTLQSEGLVEQDPETGKYYLGLGLLFLGSAALEQRELEKLSRPWLETLSSTTGENVNLGVLHQGKAMCLRAVRLRLLGGNPLPGSLYPVHSTSIGKTLVAWLPENDLDEILVRVGLPTYTEKTIVDSAEFKSHLCRIRAQGYAIEDEETELGLRCVAAPIWGHVGSVIAAISVCGPTTRLSDETLELVKREVIAAAAGISQAMGYRPSLPDASLIR